MAKDAPEEPTGSRPGRPAPEGSSVLASVAFGRDVPPMAFGDYEFGDYENNIIAKAASRTRLWGSFSIVIGLVHCFLLAPHQLFQAKLGVALTQGVTGLAGIVVGVVFYRAAMSLKQVVAKEGSDLEFMMAAIHRLGKAFLLQSLAALAVIILTFIVFVSAIGVAAVMSTSG